jgi:hypothetical protein
VQLAAALNATLPRRYYAEPHVEYGVEIDVATMETPEWKDAGDVAAGADRNSGTIEAALSWNPPPPTLTLPFTAAADIVEVRVYNQEGGADLVAAIELVSPSNKDRPAHRDAFTAKCETYLRTGLGLLIVDVVTRRQFNLHDELLDRLGESSSADRDLPLYACAYHPIERDGEVKLDVWVESVSVGAGLPTLPLWLKGGFSLPVNLETAYESARENLRIATPPMKLAE